MDLSSYIQKYCQTIYSRSGINQKWILKNSKELLETLDSYSLSKISSIKTFDFSTLYTTLPHVTLKTRLEGVIRLAFRGNRYIVLNYNWVYFVKEDSKCASKYTVDNVIKMLTFLIDNIFVQFGQELFQQVIGIPMGTNCAPLLADLFLYSYEAEFMQTLQRDDKHLARKFNFTFRYIDDVMSLNNSKFNDFVHKIYPEELEIKDTTESTNAASYLDLYLELDIRHRLSIKIYDKRDDFTFPIVNFPYLCSNIPKSPVYGVFISQLLRYARGCTTYEDFTTRGKLLTTKLLQQGYVCNRLKSTIKKFYGRHHDILDKYGRSVTSMILITMAGVVHEAEHANSFRNTRCCQIGWPIVVNM